MLPGSWIHPQSVNILRGRMDEGKSIEFCGFLNVFDLPQLNNSMLHCSLQGSSKIVKNSDSISVTCLHGMGLALAFGHEIVRYLFSCEYFKTVTWQH